ncbi:unnamed protein product, partial [Ectocarpus sp. 6 AP-2014]
EREQLAELVSRCSRPSNYFGSAWSLSEGLGDGGTCACPTEGSDGACATGESCVPGEDGYNCAAPTATPTPASTRSPAPAYFGRDATPAPIRADAVLASTTAPVAEKTTSGGVTSDANKAVTHSPSWTSDSSAVGTAIGGLVMVAAMVFVQNVVSRCGLSLLVADNTETCAAEGKHQACTHL